MDNDRYRIIANYIHDDLQSVEKLVEDQTKIKSDEIKGSPKVGFCWIDWIVNKNDLHYLIDVLVDTPFIGAIRITKWETQNENKYRNN